MPHTLESSDFQLHDLHTARILVVDDDEMNRRLLERILEKDGYSEVTVVDNGRNIVELVDDLDPHLVLLELKLPSPDGFEVLRRLAPKIGGPALLSVLIFTGDSTPDTKRKALLLGARDFLTKPFDATEALLRIRNLLVTKFLYRRLADRNVNLEMRVDERTAELQQSQNETLERLARAAEIRDDETGRHTQRVGELSAAIARSLGLGDHFVELISRSAPLHDVGKIGIPDSILMKPGELTPEETALMRSHTTIGARVLSGGKSEVMQMAERIALSHHERWGGGGYPQRLLGAEIPIEARIVAVADCVDALTHNRPYRMSWPLAQALEEIESCSGSHFDPEVVESLLTAECKRRITASPPHPWPAVTDDPNGARRLAPVR